MPSPAEVAPRRDPLEGFRLYMEPVVDMRSGVTALYRAVPALAGEEGRIYLGRHAGLKATRAGAAAAFDMRMLRETAGFVRRILEKGHRTPVVCPLTKGSLSSSRFREELRTFMESDRSVAALLVLEISQEMLAGLGASEIEGLAWLAQVGVRLALADAPHRQRRGRSADHGAPEAAGAAGARTRLLATASRAFRTCDRKGGAGGHGCRKPPCIPRGLKRLRRGLGGGLLTAGPSLPHQDATSRFSASAAGVRRCRP